MATIAVWHKLDEEHAAAVLEQAAEKLDSADGEMVLDFVGMRQIHSQVLRQLENFAALADEKRVKVVLHGVNIDIYRVLKLVNLTTRFSFVS